MRSRKGGREVVYVERGGDASAKWLFLGGLLGAGLALLYAPRSGEETRRGLQRTLWKLRAMTEEKLDEITQQFGAGRGDLDELEEEEEEEFAMEGQEGHGMRPPAPASARQELERRLAEARARRRPSPPPADLEEPLA